MNSDFSSLSVCDGSIRASGAGFRKRFLGCTLAVALLPSRGYVPMQKKYNIDPDRIGALRTEDTWLRSWVHPHDLKEAVLDAPALDTNPLPPHQEVTLSLPHE